MKNRDREKIWFSKGNGCFRTKLNQLSISMVKISKKNEKKNQNSEILRLENHMTPIITYKGLDIIVVVNQCISYIACIWITYYFIRLHTFYWI